MNIKMSNLLIISNGGSTSTESGKMRSTASQKYRCEAIRGTLKSFILRAQLRLQNAI